MLGFSFNVQSISYSLHRTAADYMSMKCLYVFEECYHNQRKCSRLSLWPEWKTQCVDKDRISCVEATLVALVFGFDSAPACCISCAPCSNSPSQTLHGAHFKPLTQSLCLSSLSLIFCLRSFILSPPLFISFALSLLPVIPPTNLFFPSAVAH